MNYKQIKAKLKRISEISDPVQCQKEIRRFYQILVGSKIEMTIAKEKCYFYPIEYEYNPEKRRGDKKRGKCLGTIALKSYRVNKEKVDSLVETGEVEKLRKYLKEL